MRLVDQILDRFMGKTGFASEIVKKLTIRDAFRRVFDTPDGRVVLNYIVRHSHVLRSTYSSKDRDLMLIREGERRLALSILRLVCGRQELQDAIEENMNDAS